MAFTGFLIIISATFLLLNGHAGLPEMTATELLGLQGMLFCAVAAIRGVWFVIRERKVLRQIWIETWQ